MFEPPQILSVVEYPLLDLRAFVTRFPRPLGQLPSPESLACLLVPEAPTPFLRAPDVDAVDVKRLVRDLLRAAGFKPTGRSKPASEYLQRAAQQQSLGSINAAVDVCNVVSLHSGLPISVIDVDKAAPPLRVDVAPAGSSYVFNPSGQVMDLGKLLCLFDANGPCANAVKDSQRTKTDERTTRTLTLIWGTSALPGRVDLALQWYEELLERYEARVDRCRLRQAGQA